MKNVTKKNRRGRNRPGRKEGRGERKKPGRKL